MGFSYNSEEGTVSSWRVCRERGGVGGHECGGTVFFFLLFLWWHSKVRILSWPPAVEGTKTGRKGERVTEGKQKTEKKVAVGALRLIKKQTERFAACRRAEDG